MPSRIASKCLLFLILFLSWSSLLDPAHSQSTVRVLGGITVGGVPVPDVWVRGLPGGVVTDEAGRFQVDLPIFWDGTLEPWLFGYRFEPATLTLSDVTSTTVADFAAVERPPGYSMLRLVEAGASFSSFASAEDLLWIGPGLYEGEDISSYDAVTYLGAGPDQVTIRAGSRGLFVGNGTDNVHVEGITFEATSGETASVFSNSRPTRLRRLRLLQPEGTALRVGGVAGESLELLVEGLEIEGGDDGIIINGSPVPGTVTFRDLEIRNVDDGMTTIPFPELNLHLELLDARNVARTALDLEVSSLLARNLLVQAGNDGLWISGPTVADIYQATLVDNDTAILALVGSDITFHDSILDGNAEGVDGSGRVALDHIVHHDGWLFAGPDYVLGDGLVEADPRFVDAVGGDFALLPDSPARGAGGNGQDVGAYGGALGDQWSMPVTTPRPALRRVMIGGEIRHQAPGGTFSFGALGIFERGYVGSINSLAAWSSSHPEVVRSLGDGSFEAVVVGSAILVVEAEGHRAEVEVRVTSAASTISPSVAVPTLADEAPLEGVSRRAEVSQPTVAMTESIDGWQRAAAMAIARDRHAATLLMDGRVLVTGGASGSNARLVSTELWDPATGRWLPGPPMLEGRSWHSATLLGDGRVLVVGDSTAEIFDPVAEVWSAAAAPAGPRTHHTATLLLDGRVLVVGGNGSASQAEIYDPSRNVWQSTGGQAISFSNHATVRLVDGRVLTVAGSEARLYMPGTGWVDAAAPIQTIFNPTATLLPDGRVLVAGGRTVDGEASQLYIPDAGEGSWQLTGALADNRQSHRAALLPDGRVLVVGGQSREAVAEIWDSASGEWAGAGMPSSGRSEAALVLLPTGRVLFIGGSISGITARCDLFQASLNSPMPAADLAETRNAFGLATLGNGRVMVAGGYHQIGTSSVEIYDPDTDIWSSGPPLGTVGYRNALPLANGSILAVGGYDAERYNPSSEDWVLTGPRQVPSGLEPSLTLLPDRRVLAVSQFGAEVYDPESDAWTATSSMIAPRSRTTLTVLPTGEVLVVGGERSRVVVPTAEIYNPTTNGWRPAEALRFPRRRHRAVALPSGEVMVMGGDDGELAHATAEIYDPIGGRWRFTLGDMSTGRSHPAAILVGGAVWVSGGESARKEVLGTTEIYDPATDLWRSGPSLLQKRTRHELAQLPGGDILVVGGRTVDRWGEYRALEKVERVTLSAVDPARRPQILDAPSTLSFGQPLVVEVSGAVGGEGHGGRPGSGAFEHPVLELRSLVDDRIIRLQPTIRPTVNFTPPSWSDEPVDLKVEQLPSSLDPGVYHLVAYRGGIASLPQTLIFQCSLAITSQPTDGLVSLGEPATFRVGVQGARAYQWRRNGENIPGATSATYTTAAVTEADLGARYDVVVTGGCVTDTSEQAVLRITDNTDPTGEILDPSRNDYWVLPVAGEPNLTETVVWTASDDVRVCGLRLWLEATTDIANASSWRPVDRAGADPNEPLATFGEGPGCAAEVPDRSYEIELDSTPPTLDGSSDGLDYRFRLEVVDHADNIFSAKGEPFAIVEPDPDGIKTLILTHSGRLRAMFPDDPDQPDPDLLSPVDDLLDDLQRLAGHPKVSGLVIDLEGSQEIAALYANWDDLVATAPDDSTGHAAANRAANNVLFGPIGATHEDGYIHGVLSKLLRGFRGVEYLVIVGGDDIVPMARLKDDANLLSEAQYEIRGGLSPGPTPDIAYRGVARALAGNTYLSDDPLSIRAAVNREALQNSLYLPDLAVGRLVETPEEMRKVIDAFLDVDGAIDLSTEGDVLVTGYDFLTDVTGNIADQWQGIVDPARVNILNEAQGPWGAEQLKSLMCPSGSSAPRVFSINGHAHHRGEGVPSGAADVIESLVAAEIEQACTDAATDLSGRVIYSVGCHAGLPVPGSVDLGEDPLTTLDLAQTYLGLGAVAYVANSGYGWGLAGGIGYGERLVQILTEELTFALSEGGAGRAVGRAVADTKRRYYLETLYYDPYDAKSLMQWTFFGLPMTALGSGDETEPPPEPLTLPAMPITSIQGNGGTVTTRDGDSLDWRMQGDETLPSGLISVFSRVDISDDLYQKYDAQGLEVNGLEGCPQPTDGGDPGCYYTLNGFAAARATGSADLPLMPYLVYDSLLSGARQHGVLWLGGEYIPETNWAPVIATLISNDGASDNAPLPQDIIVEPIDTHWPRHQDTGVGACRPSDTVVSSLVLAASEVMPAEDGSEYGHHRRYQAIEVQSLYVGAGSGSECDFEAPEIVDAPGGFHQVVGHRVDWRVPVSDNRDAEEKGTWRVIVVVDDTTEKRWRPIELIEEDGLWTGGDHFPDLALLRYVVQAVDHDGNVSWHRVSTDTRRGDMTAPAKNLPKVIHTRLGDSSVDLSVEVQAVPSSVLPGLTVLLEVTVSHLGNPGDPEAPLADAWIELELPPALQALTSSDLGWSCQGSTRLVCRRTDLLPAGTVEVLPVAVLAGTDPIHIGIDHPITVTVFHGGSDPVAANDRAELAVHIIDDPPPGVTSVGTVASTPDMLLVEREDLRVAVSQLLIRFSEPVVGAGQDSSWRLIEAGSDGVFQTSDCHGNRGDDVESALDAGYGDDDQLAWLASAEVLAIGRYRLLVCDGIEDNAGQPLASGVVRHFQVSAQHLLRNPNIDGETLTYWGSEVEGSANVDVDPQDAGGVGSSRSARIFGGSGDVGLLHQCLPVPADWQGELTVAGRALARVGETIVTVSAETFSQQDCQGEATRLSERENQIVGDSWHSLEPVGIGAGATSVRIYYSAQSANVDHGFELLLDDLVLRLADDLFADGFERGDCSAWTTCHPAN